MTPYQVRDKVLAFTVESEDGRGCKLWQGPLDNRGCAIGRDHTGKQVAMHRFVKLYEVQRTEAQIKALKGVYTHPCKDHTHCLNNAHISFSVNKGSKPTGYVDMPDWRKVYGTDVRGLPLPAEAVAEAVGLNVGS